MPKSTANLKIPIVYTLEGCPACEALKEDWDKRGVKYDERRVDESQELLDEALEYGSAVPIIRWPDGRIEEGKYKNVHG
jgi:glutaredoxin